MRPFEIALLVADLVTFLVLAIPSLRSLRWSRLLAFGAVLLATAQAALERPRWQMVPAYVLSGLFLAVSLFNRGRPEGGAAARSLLHRIVAGFVIGVGAIALALAASLPVVLPVFHFPTATGPYGIGTVTYYWVDESRPNMFAPSPGAHRELMAQVWYPALLNQEPERASYVPGISFAAIARLVHLPSFFFDQLQYVTTNAQPSVPMAGDGARFPVLIFASGRGGYRQSSTFEVEELVSHGYVVVGIDQPSTATDVAFPDGRHVSLDDRVAASVLDEHVVDDSFMLAVFDYLGQDAVFTLEQLTALNKADPQGLVAGRLDLQHAGIFGTSLGGITAAEACRLDARFKACIILDVAMPPDVVQSGPQHATMWINADAKDKRLEGWTPSNIREQQSTVQAVFAGLHGDGYLVLIPGMFHADITDLPNIFPPPVSTMLGATGPMDAARTHTVINAYSLAFFDRYLKSKPQPLLAGPSAQYPEIGLDKR